MFPVLLTVPPPKIVFKVDFIELKSNAEVATSALDFSSIKSTLNKN